MCHAHDIAISIVMPILEHVNSTWLWFGHKIGIWFLIGWTNLPRILIIIERVISDILKVRYWVRLLGLLFWCAGQILNFMGHLGCLASHWSVPVATRLVTDQWNTPVFHYPSISLDWLTSPIITGLLYLPVWFCCKWPSVSGLNNEIPQERYFRHWSESGANLLFLSLLAVVLYPMMLG